MGKPQREIDPFRDELKEIRVALGNRIRELRRLKGWSQEDFSAQAHVHRTFAGSLERGEKNVSFHALVLIARCFGMTLAELLDGLENGRAAKPKTHRKDESPDMMRKLVQEAITLEQTARTLREFASGSRPHQPPKSNPRPKRKT